MTMRSYKLILPESMAGHITYSKEKLRAGSGLSKYFNVKWGISELELPTMKVLDKSNLELSLKKFSFRLVFINQSLKGQLFDRNTLTTVHVTCWMFATK